MRSRQSFIAASVAKRLVRLDRHGVNNLLDAILKLFPLYSSTEFPVSLMEVSPTDNIVPTIWENVV